MRSKIFLMAATGGFLALALGFGWRSFRRAHEAGEAVAALTRRISTLETDLRETRTRIAEEGREVAALQAKLASAARAKAALADRRLVPVPTLLAENPKLLALHLAYFRASLPERFGAMYQALGLSPAQIAKFEDLATAQENESVDWRAASLAQGLSLSDPGVVALRKQQSAQFQAALGAEIDLGVGQALQEMGRVQPAANLVTEIGALIPSADAPLTSSQAQRLTQALADSSATYQAGGAIELGSIDWETASARMAGALSEPQLRAVQAEADLVRVGTLIRQFYAESPPGR
jgi:hypothetical protein